MGTNLKLDMMLVHPDAIANLTAQLAESYMRYTPERILKSGDCMIVFWQDGTKTVVKRSADEQDNDYAAFTAAVCIKLYGSNSALKRIVRSAEVQKPKKKRGA